MLELFTQDKANRNCPLWLCVLKHLHQLFELLELVEELYQYFAARKRRRHVVVGGNARSEF
jgi:hypothetical protein